MQTKLGPDQHAHLHSSMAVIDAHILYRNITIHLTFISCEFFYNNPMDLSVVNSRVCGLLFTTNRFCSILI